MNENKTGRAYWHDYKAKCIYLITLKKAPATPSFGRIIGDWAAPLTSPDRARIELSPLGKIVRNWVYNISYLEPKASLLQYAMMPDHVHFILTVNETLSQSVGLLIARLKAAINHAVGETGIFQDGYNDQILRRDRSLDTLFRYLRDNPRRLAVRKTHPEYFRRVNNLNIAGTNYQAFGNFQLLNCPFKDQVVVHRADSPAIRKRNHDSWLYTAVNGGVLVSPFISQAEKGIRAEAEAKGGRFILITDQPMGSRYKPTGRDFALCESGRLLIISIAPALAASEAAATASAISASPEAAATASARTASPQPAASAANTLTRAICLRMNSLAATITKL